ncbi:MAG: hypothetical protein ACE5JH_09835 [Acidobacteriota bacterium]
MIRSLALLTAAALALGAAAASRRRPPRTPAIVLATPDGRERLVEVRDLAFVCFKRSISEKGVPRSEDPRGRKIEIQVRRLSCRCLRYEDWSRVKFGKLRQIEIAYPPRERAARLRLTGRAGRLRVISAASLYGAASPLPPRFTATVDGTEREFPLVLGDATRDRWPEERLVRILLRPRTGSRRR